MRPTKPGDVHDHVHRVYVDRQVLEEFPTFSGLSIYAYDVFNGPSDHISESLLQEAEAVVRDRYSEGDLKFDDQIVIWRDAYKRFGAKPNKYHNSLEALSRRIMTQGGLPRINRLVDLYNAISVICGLPIGGEDLDRMVGSSTLRFATELDTFDPMSSSIEQTPTKVDPGEVVWADGFGVTCRRWNWRQGRRTCLTDATRNVVFIVEALASNSGPRLEKAGRYLVEALEKTNPGKKIVIERIN